MSDAGTSAAGAAGAGVGTAATWFSTLPQEDVGYLQNKGWDKPDAAAVATDVMRAYREYEKFRGVPQDQIVRFPKDAADEEGWKSLRAKMGVPTDPQAYKFEGVKFDDAALTTKFSEHMRSVAAANHLTPAQATELATSFVKFLDDHGAALEADKTAGIAAEKGKLDTSWGANKETNMFVAKQAAKALGVTDEHLSALENTIGYAATMELFRQIGMKTGEDKFVRDPGPGGRDAMTVEQAIAKRASLESDKEWVSRYRAGGMTEKRELEGLLRIIVAAQT